MPKDKPRESVAFGQAVRDARIRLGMSQDVFAERSGFHRTYVGGIERGERNPTLSTIWRLSAALQLSPSDLIERTKVKLHEIR